MGGFAFEARLTSLRSAGFAPLYLRPPPSGVEILRCVLLGSVTDPNIIYNSFRAGRLRHSGCRAFVLKHIRGPLPGGDATLNVDFEAILSDLRLLQLRLDLQLNLLIFLSRRALCRRRLFWGWGFRRLPEKCGSEPEG